MFEIKCGRIWISIKQIITIIFTCLSRHKLYRANEKLSKVLIDMVRGTVATEELIGQKISAKTVTSHQKSSVGIKDSEESGVFNVINSGWHER